ncbi:MAG: KUP/HAK/KT family potassium transporter, partial [Sphingomonas sp.]|uniref:potassium transporter Kup n=1 Tax=Sphingomonas sp. TaxID=28214 RepID=UPI0017E968EA
MNISSTGAAEPASEEQAEGHGHGGGSLAKLAVGAVGIVFGDIGTSPIYAFRETFAGHHTLRPDAIHIYGVLSLIFWSMMIIVTIKYVSIIMRADNKGEGGSLALLALINRSTGSDKRKWTTGIVLLGVFATALFYGDSMITPAISVLSAVEGLTTVNAGFTPYVIPLSIFILVCLFAIQARGTAKIGLLFAPIMLVYFSVIAVLGVVHIVDHPPVIWHMFNPWNAVAFFFDDPIPGFISMGSVVLAVTGAEALYSDMGHFGRNPIRVSWLFFVMPALLLNYMGQGAMLLAMDPAQAVETVKNPFFLLAPEILRLPLVILATLATIIASQAVISGAFSVTQQAIQLGFIPRLHITHTSEHAAGQIYIPVINWALMIMVIMLVLFFKTSSNLAAAYGIAVTGAMLIDGVLIAVVLFNLWNWNKFAASALLAVFFSVDLLYFGANLLKVPVGG